MAYTIKLAKSAGFCFGVKRAVDTAVRTATEQGGCYTYGPLIHNNSEIERLGTLGVKVTEDYKTFDKEKGTLIIRSHGVEKAVTDYLTEKDIPYIDATCPFVAKIHSIVAKAEGTVIIAGDRTHPEVMGIVGHCNEGIKVIVIADEQELQKELEALENYCENALIMVAQTTYNSSKWQSCKRIAKKYYTNIKIFDTIYNLNIKVKHTIVISISVIRAT